MESTPVDWVSPLIVFAASLVAGALLVWRVYAWARNRARKPEAAPLALRDLLGKRDALIRQLREQEDTATKRTPEQLARERYALELDAARTLLELDTHGASPVPPRRKGAGGRESAAAAVPVPAGNPALRGFLWGTACMAAVGLLLFLVLRSARPREPGGSVTGETPMESAGGSPESAAPASAAAREAQLKAALARNPEDVEVRLDLARVYMVKRNMRAAWKETQEVLQRSPGNASALTYQGLMRFAAGQPEAAVGLLKKAIASEPNLLETYLQLALVYVRLGRVPEAESTIAAASRRFPDKAAMMSEWLGRMREQAVQGQQAAADGSPSGGPGTETSRRVTGVVDLDAALRGKVAQGAVVWLIVREAGVEKGSPVAVQRFPASAFPIAFSIGEADAMAGEPFPEKVRIEARIDSDGDPLTRNPSDPSARLDGVPAGAADLRLVMTR